jgi:hypothetical protein
MNKLIRVRNNVLSVDGKTVLKMKVILKLVVLGVLAVTGLGGLRLDAADTEGVALAIIYDSSGSMGESVRAKSGKSEPKYVIANRALQAVTQQLQTFATNSSGAPRNLQAGLWIFNDAKGKEAVKFGPFNAKAFEDFAKNFKNPEGTTPLGDTLKTASQVVLKSNLSRKHVLVITDGMNTSGATPASVIPALKTQAEKAHGTLFVHFVAFDVDADVFGDVKKLGATVVGAADEKQLNSQLDYILQSKILLEEEEPKR